MAVKKKALSPIKDFYFSIYSVEEQLSWYGNDPSDLPWRSDDERPVIKFYDRASADCMLACLRQIIAASFEKDNRRNYPDPEAEVPADVRDWQQGCIAGLQVSKEWWHDSGGARKKQWSSSGG